MEIFVAALAAAALIVLAAACLYLFLRLRRLERLEDERFRYVDGRVDELAERFYASASSRDLRFDAAEARLGALETRQKADLVLQLLHAAGQGGDLPEAAARGLERQVLAWRDEADAAVEDDAAFEDKPGAQPGDPAP